MLQLILKRKGLTLLILVILIFSVISLSRLLPGYELKAFIFQKGKEADDPGKSNTSKTGQPPLTATSTTEMDMGGGKRKLVVSRDGKRKEFLIRGEILRGYMEIGGPKSVLGLPVGNEYNWSDGIRQDFERGHWLYWSDKTGLKMDYNPFGSTTLAEDALQAPIFWQGKPWVQWADQSEDKYFITQDFGVNGHLGQDLGINGNPIPGYEVRPIAAGKVIWSGWSGAGSWGYMVLIQHTLKNGRHYYSQYSHLNELPQVLTGQQVYKDTVLGYVGNTGKSTGPHLDIQIKELPEPEKDSTETNDLEKIGPGYTENRIPFYGNVYMHPETGIIYYKPSYFINNYESGSVLSAEKPQRP